MAGLLSAGGVSAGALVDVAGLFLAQMVVGAGIGILAGLALRWAAARVSLPSEGLYPLAVLFAVGMIYGVATVAHGSGFLAVFTAGIVLGDVRAPFKREMRTVPLVAGRPRRDRGLRRPRPDRRPRRTDPPERVGHRPADRARR